MDSHVRPAGFGALRPAQVLVLGFLMAIVVGTLLLALPLAASTGRTTGLVDAAFTATSAVCVTGLVVVETASHWSPLGQVIIILLIQAGGLGIMTTGTLFALITGRRIGFKERLLLHEAYGATRFSGMVRLVRLVLLTTLSLEGIGALLMTARFAQDMPLGRAAYFGVFHSISAFCNAGFDLFGDSLVGYASDLPVNLVFGTLIILGGLGFPVLVEIMQWLRQRSRFSLHALMVLATTGVLLLVGTVLILVLEYSNPATLGSLNLQGKLVSSFFQSLTARTAGFNTLATGQLLPVTLLITMMLMFVGASPGGTGGGIKTTTLAALLAAIRGALGGQREMVMFKRRVDRETLVKSLAIASLALAVVVVAVAVLLYTQAQEFLPVVFEAFSAFGTVGLSLGITQELDAWGKLVIMVTMFAGRVGPLTVFLAIAARLHRSVTYRRPEEKIMIG